jgi:hypothetical protein
MKTKYRNKKNKVEDNVNSFLQKANTCFDKLTALLFYFLCKLTTSLKANTCFKRFCFFNY